jgi:transposase-like protein
MKAPATLDEFYRMFPNERRCWTALRRMRWPDGFRCPRCGHARSHRLRKRALEQCAECRYQVSLTAGTPFHGTRVPLRIWFLAIFFLARHKKGISALQFQRDTGLGSYKTAWSLLHKVRSALAPSADCLLEGLVELDESFLGRRQMPGPRGRGARGKTVVGIAVENRGEHEGAVRLAALPRASQDALFPFIQGVTDTDEATVVTDGLPLYRGLRRHGVRHRTRIQRTGRRAPKVLPWVHTVASNLKTWLRGTFHGVSKKHLPRYLDEFTYRFDRRWNEKELFAVILRRVAHADPLPYRLLVAEGTV